MANYNKAILAGNLTRDPELRYTQSGIAVVNFGIAVNRVRSKNEEVDYFDVTAWRELGETVANYKTKGDPILIEGRLQLQQWEDKQTGSPRSKVSVVAEQVQFLSSGSSNGSSGSSANGSQANGSQPEDPEFDESDLEADIPF